MYLPGDYYTDEKQGKNNINYLLSLNLESLDAYGREASLLPPKRVRGKMADTTMNFQHCDLQQDVPQTTGCSEVLAYRG